MHHQSEHGGITYSCNRCDFQLKHGEDLTAHINTEATDINLSRGAFKSNPDAL